MAERTSGVLCCSERLWASVVVALTVWTLLAVALAQEGYFRLLALLLAGTVAVGLGVAFLRLLQPDVVPISRREMMFFLLIGIAGLLLFGWPAEHYPLLGDSAIYPNTAARLVSTGGLSYHYEPLDGLTPAQKQLFYVPSDRQLAWIQFKSYKGVLFGTYYITDVGKNVAVSSRPPAAIVWMGLFEMLFGPRSMFYVTSLFGVLSLFAVYFLGKRLYGQAAGALATLWLCVSFPQIHFSRTPYAEIPGQFFLLAAAYGLVCYLQRRRVGHLLLGVAALTAAFAARIDAILVLPALFFFLLVLAHRRDGRGLAAMVGSLVAGIGYSVWTVNRSYAGANAEMFLAGVQRLLQQPGVGLLLALGLVTLVILSFVVALVPFRLPPKIARCLWAILTACILVGVGYALHIRPLTPEYEMAGGQLVPSHNEEVMAVAAQYIGPLVFWLAACGLAVALWKYGLFSEQMFFAALIASQAVLFFSQYMVDFVYPVALRRIVPAVVPGLFLFAALALSSLARRHRWRLAAAALAGIVVASLVAVSGRYWFYQEGRGTWKFLASLEQRLPSDAVILFEPEADGSVAGWFAAPLWSFFGRPVLLLNRGELDAGALHEVLCSWHDEGREVYVVAQRPLQEWWPGHFPGGQVDLLIWRSGIIGQSRMYPPFIWDFEFQFPIYRWDGSLPGAGC